MRKVSSLIIAAVALTLAHSGFAQTATTDPVGFSTVNLPVGYAMIVPTLLNPAEFTGNAVISASGGTITPEISPAWTPNAFQESQFTNGTPNYPTYYVEVIAGAYEGYYFDIVSNSATALTVPTTDVPAVLHNQTVQVALRKHVTLDKVSTGSSGLTAYADGVNIFNSDKTTSTRFFNGTSWLAEDFATPAGHTVIYPGTGFSITTSAPSSLVLVGPVKTTKTAIYLYAGVVNIVGPLNPSNSSALVSSNIAPAMAPYADGFNILSTDGQLRTVSTYFSNGTNLLDASFTALPPNAPDALGANRGFSISVTANTVWISKSPLAP